MLIQIFVKIDGKSNLFSFVDGEKTNKEVKNDLFQFIEDRLGIHKMYFRFTNSGKSYRWLDNQEIIFHNNANFNLHCTALLKGLRLFNKKLFSIEKNLLKESVLLNTMEDLYEDGLVENEKNIITLDSEHLVSHSVIENWIVMSYHVKRHRGGKEHFYQNFDIPKPIPNNYLDKMIGKDAYNYLDNQDLDQLKKLATFCDYMDISYLLEIVCAFIANKYVKNKSVEEIKNLDLI